MYNIIVVCFLRNGNMVTLVHKLVPPNCFNRKNRIPSITPVPKSDRNTIILHNKSGCLRVLNRD